MKSVFSSVVAFLLITSAIGGGFAPIGTTSAAEAGECTALDDFVMFLTLGLVNADSCTRQAYVDAAVEDMVASDANQTKVDIYSGATGVKAGTEAWLVPYDNHLSDTESVAWMKAEAAVAEAYANGSSKAVAKVRAKEAIADYYAVRQVNLIEQYNVSISQMNTLREMALQEDGIGQYYIWLSYEPGTYSDGPDSIEGVTPRTVSLTNGSTHPTLAFHVTNPGAGPTSYYNTPAKYDTNFGSYGESRYLVVKPPNSNYEKLEAFDFKAFPQRWIQIESMNTNLQSEADVFVDATWADFDAGQVNATDVISSHTAMFEYGVRSADKDEGLWRSTAALAMMGYDTPNLMSSGTMTVEYGVGTYSGLLMARNAPNGSWEANKTYNTSAIDGPVFMLTTDGEKVDFADGREFTISGMTAKDGTAVNATETTKYVYKTANTSEMLELQGQLLDLRAEIEERELARIGAGDGIGGLFGGSIDSTTALVGVAGLAVVVILGKGGRR
ncbi:hypothetical protein VB773_01035 [Haloarculaceae archaeon H-GB2-1]|nr:hypothetical protein [Haloarculaceae archaeon H-GB1-1]MEA5406304.1 hypothetical protein [Haloarculaceae archaeon H-GB2-1]